MQVRWSPEAGDDFIGIVEYIRKRNSATSLRVARRMYQTIMSLRDHPERGRSGRVDGTRELVLAPLPYVVVYRVFKDTVQVTRVLHGAQRWP
jgi:toxin ParE1/3/4